jgi:hypothetical protein
MRLKMLAPRAELTLPNGDKVEVERIGKGRYTTAWRNCSSVYLQTNEKDYGKEIVCRAAHSKNPHIPVCTQLESEGSMYNWYKMPLYQPLTAKSGKAWQDFKVLKQMWEDARRSIGYDPKRTDEQDVYATNAAFGELVDDSTYLDESTKEAVRILLDECGNYGTYTIEITKKNCAVDGEGNLILLDAVFDLAEVRSQWKKKQQQARYY